MADNRLVVTMKGPTAARGDVRLDDFLQFLLDLRSALNETDRAVSRSDEPTAFYTVTDLRRNSPAMVVLRAQTRDPDIDLRGRVLTKFVGGIAQIMAGKSPSGLTAQLLLDYQDLARHLRSGLREASFKHGKVEAKVSSDFGDRLDALVGPDRSEHGEMSGMLDIVNVRARPFFWLFPLGRERVRCYFPARLLEQVGAAIKHHVTVSGDMRFRGHILQPFSINVEHVDVHEADADLPSLMALRGIAPNATNGERSEEFVRRLRDGW